MNTPKVSLEIGELVLEGLEVGQAERIQPAVQRELDRLFFLMGGRSWMNSRTELALPDASIEVPPGSRPEDIGVRIARDLFAQLNVSRPPDPIPGGRP